MMRKNIEARVVIPKKGFTDLEKVQRTEVESEVGIMTNRVQEIICENKSMCPVEPIAQNEKDTVAGLECSKGGTYCFLVEYNNIALGFLSEAVKRNTCK